jgi:hypothetical protein
MVPLLVAGVNSTLPFHAEEGAPRAIPFSGNYNTNILIARTVRDIEVADMNPASERFQEWNFRLSRTTRAELDALEFKDIAEAMGDGEFTGLSRLVAHSAYANAIEALSAKSVRKDLYAADGYSSNQAENLIIFGRDRESFADKLIATAVIEIRADAKAGAKATLQPIGVYADKFERGLVVVGQNPTQSIGPNGQIVASSTTGGAGDADVTQ